MGSLVAIPRLSSTQKTMLTQVALIKIKSANRIAFHFVRKSSGLATQGGLRPPFFPVFLKNSNFPRPYVNMLNFVKYAWPTTRIGMTKIQLLSHFTFYIHYGCCIKRYCYYSLESLTARYDNMSSFRAYQPHKTFMCTQIKYTLCVFGEDRKYCIW